MVGKTHVLSTSTMHAPLLLPSLCPLSTQFLQIPTEEKRKWVSYPPVKKSRKREEELKVMCMLLSEDICDLLCPHSDVVSSKATQIWKLQWHISLGSEL